MLTSASSGSSSSHASMSSLASRSSRGGSAPSSRSRLSHLSEPKQTLTPSRKHRKMLKNGQGEVWPEYIEEIFVEGLRAYWRSSSVSFQSGRSRERNDFIVKYLGEMRIERTKKQVASHIQVLRSMWGKPEHKDLRMLVASIDELIDEGGVPRDKEAIEKLMGRAWVPLDHRRRVPKIREPQIKEEFEGEALGELPSEYDYVKAEPMSSPPSLNLNTNNLHALSSPLAATLSPLSSVGSSPEDSFTGSDVFFPPQGRGRSLSYLALSPAAAMDTASLPHVASPRTRLSSLSVWAQGMDYVTAPLTHLLASPTRMAIRVGLTASLLNDMAADPNMNGFQVVVTLTGAYQNACCLSRVILNGEIEAEQRASLDLFSSTGTEYAYVLNDTWLAQCRWRNSGVHTCFAQHIFIDGQEVAVVFYDLTRSPGPATATIRETTWREQSLHREDYNAFLSQLGAHVPRVQAASLSGTATSPASGPHAQPPAPSIAYAQQQQATSPAYTWSSAPLPVQQPTHTHAPHHATYFNQALPYNQPAAGRAPIGSTAYGGNAAVPRVLPTTSTLFS
ncbi:unnamed protein product [Peniophora sp. CBMAI 1063]|nr:unnamed protein product [Peniophora sp. CBMAI 1063]